MGGLVFPATSLATTDQIKTKPINKGPGFHLTLAIHQGQPTGYGGRYPNSVAGVLFKHTTKGTENDNYSFSGSKAHPLKFQQGSKPASLQFAKVTGTFGNSGGSINLTFHATGPAHHVSVPKGCTGHAGQSRPGTLSGSYVLHANKLGPITQKSFQATISSASFQCNKATHGYDVQTTGFKPAWLDVFKSSSTAPVSEEIEVSKGGTSDWVYEYTFKVSGLLTSHYKINTTSNLSKATVIGGGAITGTANYTSTKKSSHQTVGNMSGSLAVTFASIGNVKVFPSSRSAKQSHS
jgi:hypothetical protein